MIYTLKVSGMTCSSCVNSVEGSLNSIPGVKATVSFATESVHVNAEDDVSTKTLIAAIKSAGYSATLVTDPSQLALHSKRSGLALALSILSAVPAIAISMIMSWHHAIDMFVHDQLDAFGLPHPLYSPTAWVAIGLTAPLILLVAFPIHRAAFNNFLIFINPKRNGALTMDNLVSLGSLAAFGWSIYANATGNGDVYTEVAAGVLLFVILGRYLEARAKANAGSALQSLLELGSKEVTVIRCPIYVPNKLSGINRIVHDFSFLFSSFWALLYLRIFHQKFDYILSVAPPFLIGLNSIFYKLTSSKTKVIYHVQDLQIDAADQIGMIKSGLLLKIMYSVERFIIKKVDVVTTISDGMKSGVSKS